ncbi:MAG: WG repeat-containing protein [Veillonella parvula]|nr:WG repeat-containing protein [Veillonella parvula]
MNINKKSLLVACVLAAMSTTTFAASTTTSTSSTTVTNHDTPTSTSTRVTREQHTTTTSTSTVRTESSSSTKSTKASVGVMTPQKLEERSALSGYIAADVSSALNPYRDAPKSLKSGKGTTFKNDEVLEHGVLASMKQGGKWGIIRPDGTVAIEPKYKEIKDVDYKTGNVLAQVDKKTETWVTPKGVEISEEEALKERVKQEATQEYPSDSYVEFKEKGKYGFKTTDDKVVIAPQFRQIVTGFSEDRAFVKNAKGKIVAIDGTGKELFNAPSKEVYAFRNGLAEYRRSVSGFNLGGLVGGFIVGGILGGALLGGQHYHVGGFAYDGAKRGYIDRSGNIVIDSKKDKVWPITAYGTVIKDAGNLYFVNRKGEVVIQPGDYDAGEMDKLNGLLALRDNKTEKWGIFDVSTGKQVVSFKYDSISFAGTDRLVVVKDHVKNLIDMNSGKSLYSAQTEATIEPFNNDTVTWVHTGKEGYTIIDNNGHILFRDTMNSKGEWLVQPTYDAVNVL